MKKYALCILTICTVFIFSCKKNSESGLKIYVAGYEDLGLNHPLAKYWESLIKFWEKGAPVYLTNNTTEGMLLSSAISGSDYYVAGYKYIQAKNHAFYWKNNEP